MTNSIEPDAHLPSSLRDITATNVIPTQSQLENTLRNGKKKSYWRGFDIVMETTTKDTQTGLQQKHETRYDAYLVNHSHIKKFHSGGNSTGTAYVRVECKLCTNPRFIQSITVSTKKFEEHYNTLHAANTQDISTSHISPSKNGTFKRESTSPLHSHQQKKHRPLNQTGSSVDADVAAAVVALGHPERCSTPSNVDSDLTIEAQGMESAETKRVKKGYWTAYDVVVTTSRPGSTKLDDNSEKVHETRYAAWRVNHNALRRLHLANDNDTTVRVECRFCQGLQRFSQSITVSTKKFQQHLETEHSQQLVTELLDIETIPDMNIVPQHEHHSPLPDSTNTLATDVNTKSKTHSILNWLVHDSHPLSTITSSTFHALYPSSPVISMTNLTTELDAIYQSVLTEIKLLLHQERSAGTQFTLVLDAFITSLGELRMLVHVRCITSSWHRKSWLLACRSIPHPMEQTQVNDVLIRIVNEFELLRSIACVVVRAKDAKLLTAAQTLAHTQETSLGYPMIVLTCVEQAIENAVRGGFQTIETLLKSVRMYCVLHPNSICSLDIPSLGWKSTYSMLKAVVNLQEMEGENISTSERLSKDEIAQIQSVVLFIESNLLHFEAESSGKVEYMSIVEIYEQFHRLQAQLKSFIDSEAQGIDQLIAKAILVSLEEQYNAVLPRDAQIGMVLNPCVRLDPWSHDQNILVDIKRSLMETILKKTNETRASSSTVDQDVATTVHVVMELDAYLALENCENENPLTWWKNHEDTFPVMSRMARSYLVCVRDVMDEINKVRICQSGVEPEWMEKMALVYESQVLKEKYV